MIEKINKNVYGYSDNMRQRKPAGVQAYENTPGSRSAKRTLHAPDARSGKKAGLSQVRANQKQGVILDLSLKKTQEAEKQPRKAQRWSVWKFFTAIGKWLRDFWYSDSGQEKAATDAVLQASEGKEAEDALSKEKSAEPTRLVIDDGKKAAEDAITAVYAEVDGGRMPGQEDAAGIQEHRIEAGSEKNATDAKAAADTEGAVRKQQAADASMENKAPVNAEMTTEDVPAKPDAKKRSMTETLMEALYRKILTLDDLDAVQIRLLMRSGIDVEQIAQGVFDFEAYFSPPEPEAAEIPDELAAAEEAMAELPPLEEDEDLVSYQEELQKVFQAGDLKRIEEIVTQNGAKRLARNTDLLTFYNKNGKLVEVDDTEKHRVLYGDRNILKL